MGQKVNPNGLRLGITAGWKSQWYADKKSFASFIKEDNEIRKFIKTNYKNCGISAILIERGENKVNITLDTSKPGVVIGQKGAGVDAMKKEVANLVNGKQVNINVVEVKNPDFNAQLVAESIAFQLEQRVGFRRAMKQALNRCQRAGVKGIKIMVGGRLDGAEIARSEFYQEGSLPLQTLRADIDYGYATAKAYGSTGVKVWIYKGEVLGKKDLTIRGGNKNVDA